VDERNSDFRGESKHTGGPGKAAIFIAASRFRCRRGRFAGRMFSSSSLLESESRFKCRTVAV